MVNLLLVLRLHFVNYHCKNSLPEVHEDSSTPTANTCCHTPHDTIYQAFLV